MESNRNRRQPAKPVSFKEYIENLNLEKLFRKLKAPNPSLLAKEVNYFTTREADDRDKILFGYFGENGINRITNLICEFLFSSPRLPTKAKVLDVGAGTGFFTVNIYDRVREKLPEVCFYAIDAAPAMLTSLDEKIKERRSKITPFVGIAENIKGSVEEARKYFNVPRKFDAVFSTLMLHHSIEPEKVFKSIKEVLKKGGKAIIIDLCKHGFEEFKTEMGDVHLGFDLQSIGEMACKYFSEVKIEKVTNICCECSGRSAEVFAAFLK